jgi:hypothetical protein
MEIMERSSISVLYILRIVSSGYSSMLRHPLSRRGVVSHVLDDYPRAAMRSQELLFCDFLDVCDLLTLVGRGHIRRAEKNAS